MQAPDADTADHDQRGHPHLPRHRHRDQDQDYAEYTDRSRLEQLHTYLFFRSHLLIKLLCNSSPRDSSNLRESYFRTDRM